MYKKNEKSWMKHADFILWDCIILQFAYVLAYVTRQGFGNPYVQSSYTVGGLILVLTAILGSLFFENHKGILRRNSLTELKYVTQLAVLSGITILVYLFFAKNSSDVSRIVIFLFFCYSIVLLWIERVLWKKWLLVQRKLNVKKRQMLLLSNSKEVEKVLTTIQENSMGEFEIIGVVLTDNGSKTGTEIQGVKVVCQFEDVVNYVQTKWIDEVMVCLSKNDHTPEKELDAFAVMGITTHINLNMEFKRKSQIGVEKIAGCMVLTESVRISGYRQIFLKRIVDILGAIVGLVFTGIITIFIGPVIYFSDPGPIFFCQNRVGKNGRVFKMYKFRSMYMDAEERKKELMDKNTMQGFMFKMDADPRIIGSGSDGTKHGIGWFIRKTSLDEFPQFFCVLKGDMSLVGTRPPTLDEWEKYENHHRARMAIKPGITGLWQISGRNEITDFEEVIALDMEYINNWTLLGDLQMIFKTVGVIFSSRGAK